MDEIELLSGVLTKTTTVVAGVGEDQWGSRRRAGSSAFMT